MKKVIGWLGLLLFLLATVLALIGSYFVNGWFGLSLTLITAGVIAYHWANDYIERKEWE